MNRTILRHLKSEEIDMERPVPSKDIIPDLHLFAHLCNLRKLERVAEIGVFGGGLIKRVLQNCSTVKEYYAVDPWKVYIESYDRPPHARERSQDWWETIYQKVVVIQKEWPGVVIIKRMESIAAAKELSFKIDTDDKKFDAVYIDSIHDVENLCNDIKAWLPLIKDYGVITGHDYIKRYMDMMIFLEDLFGKDFNFWHIDKSKPRRAYKNQAQGGNWWVNLTPSLKNKIMEDLNSKFSNLLFDENKGE